jgi:hypothetical protein
MKHFSQASKMDYISIKELASLLKIDRSHARRYVLRHGYRFHKRRTTDSRNQLTLCVTKTEANAIIARRSASGFTAPTVVTTADVGFFYVIQLVPDLDEKRLKLGFTENLDQRLSQHRTAAPTACVVRAWPCKRQWELAAIDALSQGCVPILNEVFDCENIDSLIKRGDAFFFALPSLI